jgi:hypothetical protein
MQARSDVASRKDTLQVDLAAELEFPRIIFPRRTASRVLAGQSCHLDFVDFTSQDSHVLHLPDHLDAEDSDETLPLRL